MSFKKNRFVKKHLVTTALPYANGFLHIGHIFGCVFSDVWVRFNKQVNGDFLHICGDDAHGTPIMLTAAKENIVVRDLLSYYYEAHKRDLVCFGVEYDNYYTTHSKENEDFVLFVYKQLFAHGFIGFLEILKLYDTTYNIFLPDRYVVGKCYKCGAAEQYGDCCVICGVYYNTSDIIDPVSLLSKCKPVLRLTGNYFFKLNLFIRLLNKWILYVNTELTIKKKITDWLMRGLLDWDISRDDPYFGIKFPGVNKYFYVWMDAPLGYVSSFMSLCTVTNEVNFFDYWDSGSFYDVHTFIGKDIVYFHVLFWPALLLSSGLRCPTTLVAHGFLTVQGEKMSKSKGTMVTARHYLRYYDPDFLRYYFSSKINGTLSDIDFCVTDFVNTINSDVVGKYVNIAGRVSFFLDSYFSNYLSDDVDDLVFFSFFVKQYKVIFFNYQVKRYSNVIKHVFTLISLINTYINEQKPWLLCGDGAKRVRLHRMCSLVLNLFKVVSFYLKPIIPSIVADIEFFLNIDFISVKNYYKPLRLHRIRKFTYITQRIDVNCATKVFNVNVF